MLDSLPQLDLALDFARLWGENELTGGLNDGIRELIIEVCRTWRAYDLGPKLSLHERVEVDESVAFVIDQARVEWRVLEAGSYRLLKADQGIFRSRVFPDLWLDEEAFWRYDLDRLRTVLDQGLRSNEHATFLARFNSR